MVSVASLLNHVPSETAQRIHLPPSPMSISSSHCANTASSASTSTSTSPALIASSLVLNRIVHNSSVHQANGQINGSISASNAPIQTTIISNHSNHGIGGQAKKQKMSKDGAVFIKGKIKGEVNFPPFENLDELTTNEVLKFHVYPLGKITEYCRHIPYNSEKKTFLEKTGRESFEVFQYIFRVPDDDKDYTVMWDYNTGLVRITPFFKCCKFTKTTPAKMLNLNPGLKEITHSITGGALVAQGYWMPYACALAVCATFCHHIAPALIPIFGPSFPSRCVVPEAPEHGRFSIDPTIVIESTKEAERYRMLYSSTLGNLHNSRDSSYRSETRIPSPRSTPSEMRIMESRDREMMDRGRERDKDDPRERERETHRDYQHDREIRTPLPSTSYLGKRFRLNKRNFGRSNSPYGSGSTDTDIEYTSESSTDRFHLSPFTPSSEKSVITSRPSFELPYVPAITPPRTNPELPSPWLTALPGGRLSNFIPSNNPSYMHHSYSHSQPHFQPISRPTINNNSKHPYYFPPPHHNHQHPPTSTTSSPDLQKQNLRNAPQPQPQPLIERSRSQWRPKRRIAEFLGHTNKANEFDDGYDGEHEESTSSGSGSDRDGVHSNATSTQVEVGENNEVGGRSDEGDRAEKKAAWLLMNLSVRDAGSCAAPHGGSFTFSREGMPSMGMGGSREGVGLGLRIGGQMMTIGGGDGSADLRGDVDGPRVKRRRALSM